MCRSSSLYSYWNCIGISLVICKNENRNKVDKSTVKEEKMEPLLRKFMVLTLQALRLVVDHVDLETVEAENEWVELEVDISKLINKLKE